MNELIDYILKKVEAGVEAEDIYVELKIIKKMLGFIPSYQQEDAIKALMEEDDAE